MKSSQPNSRPYIARWWTELSNLSETNWNDPDVLGSIYGELEHRTRAKATRLRSEVKQRLDELAQDGPFVWPSTDAREGKSDLKEFDAPKVGMLRHLGYRTGVRGIDDRDRHEILVRVFLKALPRFQYQAYMSEWASPGSCRRLQKLAESIASFARNAKRKKHSTFKLAIEEWELDLAFLKKKFYVDSRCSFDWPRT